MRLWQAISREFDDGVKFAFNYDAYFVYSRVAYEYNVYMHAAKVINKN